MSSLTVTPLSIALGAEIRGVDITQPLNLEQRDAIEQALLAHSVLFFRGQVITPQQQARFAANFGDLHIHPIYPNVPEQPEVLILDTAVTDVRDNAVWHTDVTFLPTPALGAVLSAKLLPAFGGDTLWASGIAAYEALSEPLKGLLDGLTATTHWSAYGDLERLGAIPVADRVVEHLDRRLITAAGVSSGIDMALRLVEVLVDRTAAQACQLMIEYDPQPHVDVGSLAKSNDEVMARFVEYVASGRR